MHLHVSVRLSLFCVYVCMCVVCVCFCVCMFEKPQRQEKPWWSIDTDMQIVRNTWKKGAKDKTEPSHSWFPPTIPSG